MCVGVGVWVGVDVGVGVGVGVGVCRWSSADIAKLHGISPDMVCAGSGSDDILGVLLQKKK